jgi:hypothetical protein
MIIENNEAAQRTSFFLALQNSEGLDLRDNRGKRHALNIVLLGVLVALLRNRDGKLSSIHRAMENTHSRLMEELNLIYSIDYQKVVSRSHLPVLLQKVNVSVFSELIFKHYSITLTEEEKAWFAVDGKELRGTIAAGCTRGEAIVQVVRHEDRAVLSQGYYNGSKESEQPVVQQLLKQNGLARQGLTFDALHFNPKTLNYIEFHGGHYIGGLKGNQEEILTDMKQFITVENADFQLIEVEKGHGREETRKYYCKSIEGEYLDKRWRFAGLTTVIMVKRSRLINSYQKYSEDTNYYMSNLKVVNQDTANLIFQNIRGHWGVEVNNHIRDVTFKEDKLITKFKYVARPITLCRTLVMRWLQKENVGNYAQKMDLFADDFEQTLLFLKNVNVL